MQHATPETLNLSRLIGRAICLLCLAAALSCSQEPAPLNQRASQGSTYYVAADGSDRSSGRSPADPWKTVSKVNATFFEPGDRIHFRRGDTWREQLTISSSGRQNQPVVLAAYGRGARPRFAGTVATLPFRNAVRNAGFEEFTGVADDGLSDDFLHFFHGGGRVEAVSDTPAGGGDVALCLRSDGSGAGVYAVVYLPANARVQMRWQAKSIHGDGALTIRHWLKDHGAVFLQDDLRSWSTQPNWDAVAIAGGADGVWRTRSIEFTTDDAAGAYQVDFSSAGVQAASWIDSIELVIRWEAGEDHLFRLGTGYKPKRVLLRTGGKWLPALNGEDFNRRVDTLDDRMWLYDPAGGVLFFRDDADRILDAGTSVEISVPETGVEGECGIYIDQAHITVADLSVVGWPDDNPAFDDAGGIAVTANAERTTVTGCEVAFNYRVGLMSRAGSGTYTGNVFVYNGGNGLAFARPAHHNIIAHNEAGYNGYWGNSSDDGEGISLGEGTADNLLESNEIHHNNRHPLSHNPGGLVLYHSNRNIIRYNRVHANYKAGAVIDGSENRFYYNLVYGNGIGYADTDAPVMCNVMVRNYSPDGPGGNKVYNNIFFAGTSDTRWMANLFINRDCTDTEIRNNVFWGFTNDGHNNVQIRVDGNLRLGGLQLSNNVIGPEAPGFIHFDGSDYATVEDYRAATGQGAGSLSDEPDFLDPNAADFRPIDVSAVIDAGRYVGLVSDFDLNPVDNFPDIGAFEYQPF